MPEAQEGPSQHVIKAQQRQHLQELSVGMVLGEQRADIPPLTAADRSRIEKSRANLQLGKWEASIADMEETPEETTSRLGKMIDRFGIRHKSSGEKDRTSEEDTRFKKAEESLKTVTEFLTNGYDNLRPEQQEKIRENVEQALVRHGTIGQEFALLDDNQKKAVIERMIKEPNFVKNMRQHLRRTANQRLTSDSKIRAIQTELRSSAAQKATDDKKLERANKDIERAEESLSKAQKGEATGARAAAINKQIEAFQGYIETTRDEIAKLIERQTQLRASYEGQENVNVVAFEEYQKRERAIEQKQSQLTQQQSRIQMFQESLIATIPDDTQLEEKLDQKRDKADELAAKLDTPQDAAEKRIEEKELAEQRAHEEQAIADSLENAFLRAAQGKINEDLRLAYGALEAESASVDDDTKSKARKDIRKAFESRWMESVTKRNGKMGRQRREQVLNLGQVNQDFQAIMENGPDALLKSVLTESKQNRFGRTRGGRIFSDGEIATMMEDKDFAKEMKQDMIKYVVSNTLLSRRLRPAEVHQILNSSWGGEAIDDAITNNQEFRNTLTSLAETDNVDMASATFKDRFKREALKRPAWLFSVIGTIPWLANALTRATWQTMTHDERKHLSAQLA